MGVENLDVANVDTNDDDDDDEVVIPSLAEIMSAMASSDGEESQKNDDDNDDDDYKPIAVPKVKVFDVSSFQQYTSTINGNLGGKDSDSDDDDDDDESKSDKSDEKSVKSEASDDSSVDPEEGVPAKFLAFHAIQKAGGGADSMLSPRSAAAPPNRRNQMKRDLSINLNSLALGNSSRNLGESSVADIANALTMKQEMVKQGVRFSDDVDEKHISKLRQSCINLMFYQSQEFAAFKYEAFMEECGLDPNEYD